MVLANKLKVLIVEDEASWRALAKTIATEAGYLVISTSRFDEAIDLISRHLFHAALIDIRLVDPDPANEQGVAVMQRLLDQGEKTGLIVLTGYPTIERVRDAFKQYDVIDFLSKDTFREEELLRALESAVTQSTKHLATREKEDLQLTNLLCRYSPHEIEEHLPKVLHGNFISILQSLAHPLIPLQTAGTWEKFDLASQLPVFETRYWSRFLGEAVVIRLGYRKQIVEEAKQLRKSGVDVFIDTRESLSGLRYVAHGMSPDMFTR